MCQPEGGDIIRKSLQDKVYQRHFLISFTTGGGRFQNKKAEGEKEERLGISSGLSERYQQAHPFLRYIINVSTCIFSEYICVYV